MGYTIWPDSPDGEVLAEVHDERQRQEDKWGEQNHPSIADELLDHMADAQEVAAHYKIPTAAEAKAACQKRADRGLCTYADILIEEVAEAVEAAITTDDTEAALRAELVQVAAVAVAWIEKIDRKNAAK